MVDVETHFTQYCLWDLNSSKKTESICNSDEKKIWDKGDTCIFYHFSVEKDVIGTLAMLCCGCLNKYPQYSSSETNKTLATLNCFSDVI